jgi:hypothetical protein
MQQSASIESLDVPRIAANIRAFLAFAQDRCGTAGWRLRLGQHKCDLWVNPTIFAGICQLQVYPMKVILSGLETMTVTRGNRDLAVPRNTTLLFLPPFAPELNPNKNPL